METLNEARLGELLALIRPEVRREKPYVVGGVPDVQVKLNQNESPYDLPGDLKRDLIEHYVRVPFNRYPSEQPDRLRRALAEAIGHDPDGLLVGNGSNELTHTLGLTLIETGTPVVLPTPMFALYSTVVRLFGGRVVAVPPRDDLSFDAEGLVETLQREQAPLVVLATPNNPTGRAMTLDEVRRVVAAAPGYVVVDEAYVEFNDEGSAQALLEDHPRVLILRTFSKALGLAGLRIGYLMGHPRIVQELLKARLPFMVDRLAEAAAMALLARPDLLEARVREMKAERDRLVEAMTALEAVRVVPSQANFVIFKTEQEPEVLMHRLAESGVLVRNVSGYPELKGYLRVSAGAPQENKAFLAALKKALRAPE